MFCILLTAAWFNTGHNCYGKIIHSQFCKYFLQLKFVVFGMEMDQSNGIFKLTEGIFLVPPEVIELCYVLKRENLFREMGNNVFCQ